MGTNLELIKKGRNSWRGNDHSYLFPHSCIQQTFSGTFSMADSLVCTVGTKKRPDFCSQNLPC